MSIVFVPFAIFLVIAVGRFFALSLRTKRKVSAQRTRYQKRVRLLGLGILVSGLLIAASIYMHAALDDEATATTPGADRGQFQHTFAPAQTKKSDLAMESFTGKEGVLGNEITEWYKSLGHGRRLAYTVAVISLAGFLTCLFIAHPHLAEQEAPAEPASEP